MLDRDGPLLGERRRDKRVVAQEVHFARQAVGRLEDRLDGRGLEERQLGAGEPQQVREVLRQLVAREAGRW